MGNEKTQKRVAIKDLTEGLTTAKQVISDHGILLEEGTQITIQHINLLKKWKVRKIWIYDDTADLPKKDYIKSVAKKKNVLKIPVKSVKESMASKKVTRPVVQSPEELKNYSFDEPDVTSPLILLKSDDDETANIRPDNVNTAEWAAQTYNNCSANAEEMLLSARNDSLNEKAVISIIKKIHTNLQYNWNDTLSLSTSDSPENYLVAHSLNCAILSMAMGMEMKMEKIEIESLGAGALLHDIGMTKVENLIWALPRRLSEDEKFFIWKHTLYGADILTKTRHFKGIATSMAYQHHEKIDSSGYPKGKNGAIMHKFSKIISCVDTFAALTCSRPYRPAFNDKIAFNLMKELKNDQLDPDLTTLLLEMAKRNRLIDPYVKTDVLIIEDDKLTSKMLSRFLEHSYINVHLAENGLEGLDKTKYFKPDLILLDIMMPEMDGYGFMKNFIELEELSKTPVIVITSKATVEDVRKMMKFGVKNFIRKPCDQKQLRNQILPLLELDEEIIEFV